VSGLGVFVPASIPEVTAVGGTEFLEGTGKYWSDAAGENLATALSYIPEMAWNDTVQDGGLAATGGGISIFYPRPEWQTGQGIPDDQWRHVPDIAFSASWDHDGYQVIMHGAAGSAGGTSATAPFFAGVLALLNQQLSGSGSQERLGLGNINPKLYQLARTTPEIFHDITLGSNIVPCRSGTADCGASGQYGHSAARGYDHATGLGSIDIDMLLRSWDR
jgi:subtilase family serine protease